jgi:hypothetical protein
MKTLERIIHWLFSSHGVCDDIPDSRALPPKKVVTGMEFDSGEDMLKNG